MINPGRSAAQVTCLRHELCSCHVPRPAAVLVRIVAIGAIPVDGLSWSRTGMSGRGHDGRGVLPLDSRGMRWEWLVHAICVALSLPKQILLAESNSPRGYRTGHPESRGARAQWQVKERRSRSYSVTFEWLWRMPEQSVELAMIVMNLRVNVFRG